MALQPIFDSIVETIEEIAQPNEARLLARMIQKSEIPAESIHRLIEAWKRMVRVHSWSVFDEKDFEGVIADLEARQATSEKNILIEKLSMGVKDFFSTSWFSQALFCCGYNYVYQVCEKTRGELLSALNRIEQLASANDQLAGAIEEELEGSDLSFGMTLSDEFKAKLPQP